MSDPNLEEDTLVSQADIDKLLDSSSIEETGGNLSNTDSDGVDELGELSQADIDALMNSNVTQPEPSMSGDEDDDMELISQSDIDLLMSSDVSSDDEDTSSSDDENPVPSDEDDAFEMISQDDINKLMAGESEDAGIEVNDTLEQDPLVLEDDIALAMDEPQVSAEMGDPAEDSPLEDEYLIDESQAVDVPGNLITQETLDDLIANFDDDAGTEPLVPDPVVPELVVLDEDPEEPDPVIEFDESGVPEDSDLDDLEDFLKPDSDVASFDFDEEDVTQDDIDALLLESDDDEDDILISQDDIDTLLMAADQEDEDVLGDLMDEEFDAGMDEDFEDEDILASDNSDDDPYEDPDDQVVLEGEDDDQPYDPEKAARARWYESKLVIACASALVGLGIAVPLTYFIFFGGPQGASRVDPVAEPAVGREIEIETVDINIKTPVMDKQPGNMILKDFVILASDVSKDLGYITADISIDYSDQKAYHEIQNNLSFYRDLIYGALNKSLVSEKSDGITEADILFRVETSLKKVLPGHYIDRVSFKSFKAS